MLAFFTEGISLNLYSA